VQRVAVSCLILFASFNALPAEENRLLESVEIDGTQRHLGLSTRAGAPHDAGMVNRDVHRLWLTGWFEDIVVERPSPERVVFHVIEKPVLRLREVRFQPDHQQNRRAEVEPGGPIDEIRARGIAGEVKRDLVEEGYDEARVTPTITPAGDGLADLLLRVETGARQRIDNVRFSGDLGLDEDQLKNALRATRIGTRIPFVWKSRPGFSEAALQTDLARLRSLYIEHGFFDAQIQRPQVVHQGDLTVVTIPIDAGDPHETEVAWRGVRPPEGPVPMDRLCACLLAERRQAGREGRIDFQTRIELLDRPDSQPTTVTAFVDAGEPYHLGRLDFRGHHQVSGGTLRRAMKLAEGDLFNADRFEASLARLSRMTMIEPLTPENVSIGRNPAARSVDVSIRVEETPRGRWSLSGPALPLKFAGPFQAAVSSRLPAWGSGLFELSTYYASLSVAGIPGPVASLLGLTPWLPVVSLSRPIVPGQEWLSGFALSPQLNWRTTLLGYGAGQLQARLPARRSPGPSLVAPVYREETAGQDAAASSFLICERKLSRWRTVARVVNSAASLLFPMN
jgi:outer membrane protein insertion porin family